LTDRRGNPSHRLDGHLGGLRYDADLFFLSGLINANDGCVLGGCDVDPVSFSLEFDVFSIIELSSMLGGMPPRSTLRTEKDLRG
jgi:hypothetical protein